MLTKEEKAIRGKLAVMMISAEACFTYGNGISLVVEVHHSNQEVAQHLMAKLYRLHRRNFEVVNLVLKWVSPKGINMSVAYTQV